MARSVGLGVTMGSMTTTENVQPITDWSVCVACSGNLKDWEPLPGTPRERVRVDLVLAGDGAVLRVAEPVTLKFTVATSIPWVTLAVIDDEGLLIIVFDNPQRAVFDQELEFVLNP